MKCLLLGSRPITTNGEKLLSCAASATHCNALKSGVSCVTTNQFECIAKFNQTVRAQTAYSKVDGTLLTAWLTVLTIAQTVLFMLTEIDKTICAYAL